MIPVVMKIPEPTMIPAARNVESRRPSSRRRAVAEGASLIVGR
jgi:hypothetical protein